MIQVHDLLVLSQRPFVDGQVRSAFAGRRPAAFGRLLRHLLGAAPR